MPIMLPAGSLCYHDACSPKLCVGRKYLNLTNKCGATPEQPSRKPVLISGIVKYQTRHHDRDNWPLWILGHDQTNTGNTNYEPSKPNLNGTTNNSNKPITVQWVIDHRPWVKMVSHTFFGNSDLLRIFVPARLRFVKVNQTNKKYWDGNDV